MDNLNFGTRPWVAFLMPEKFSAPNSTCVKLEIKNSSFEEVLPIWTSCLWPGRVSAIHPTHKISYFKAIGGTVEEEIDEPDPIFVAGWCRDSIVGAVSGYKTSKTTFRVRGLCVLPEFRMYNVGSKLMDYIFDHAKTEGCERVWSIPRISSWPFYEKMGFLQKSEFFNAGMEFGPNCFAEFEICKKN